MKARIPWTWWSALALTAMYVLLPGPRRSPFSGLPLASKATLLFSALLILMLFTAMFRPYRRPRVIWTVGILVLIVAKVLLAPPLILSGWKGVYRHAPRLHGKQVFAPFRTGWFLNRGIAWEQNRVDRVIDFDGVTFGLAYINEPTEPTSEATLERRDVGQPLIVRWTGHTSVAEARPLRMAVSANGRLIIDVDGQRVFDARNPEQAAVEAPLSAGPHEIVITYIKRARANPGVRIETEEPVTPAPADAAQLQKSARAERTINAIGLLALLLLFLAWLDAYWPLRKLIFEDLWARPDKVAAVIVTGYFIAQAALVSIPARHATIVIGTADDPLAYEGYARLIARNGPMLRDDNGEADAYFFYPLYSYGLALAHTFVGDDYSAIFFYNYMCIAAAVLLMWAILRNYLSRGALAFLLPLVVAPFASANLGWYVETALSDNLFVPMVLLMILASVTAFERRSIGWLFVAGMFTAIGAATRTSLLTHLAFMGLAILLYREFGRIERRLRGCAAFVMGFAIGVAPFTLRNWIVTKKFTLIVSSIVQIPYFLYAGLGPSPPLMIDGRMPTFLESMGQFIRFYSSDPVHFTLVEIRKVLFTLGFIDAGPAGIVAPKYLIFVPVLFGLALWLRQVAKPVQAALLAFCASHLTAMVMATPWGYGFKTILPFMLSMIAGAAFLLPHAKQRRAALRPRVPLPPEPSVTVITVDASGYGAEFRQRLADATGDLVAVVPADRAYDAGDLNRLIAFSNDYDAVFGSRRAEHSFAALRVSNALAKWTGVLYDSTEPLSDIGCEMWLMRREAIAALADHFSDAGEAFTADVLLLALREGFRVIQVPVQYHESLATERPDVSRWALAALRVITSRVREKRPERDVESAPDA